jgi:hypothetical protein
MVNFTDVILKLEDLGLSDVVLPFILIFTVVFAVMEKAGILNKDEKSNDGKKFHAVIALAISLGVVIPHVTNSYPDPRYDAVVLINTALPNVSVLLIAILAALIIGGMFGLNFPGHNGNGLGMFTWIFALGAIGFIFGRAAGWIGGLPSWLSFLDDPETQALILIILVFGIIIRFITKEDDGKTKPKWYDSTHEFWNRFAGP